MDEKDRLLARYKAALEYIHSPTMGLPPGVDPATFAQSGASEQMVRMALSNCIEQARTALDDGVSEDNVV